MNSPELQKTRGWYGLNSFRVKTETSPDPEDWKQVAQALGKSMPYINRFAAVTESGQPARAHRTMEQDFSAYKQISIELWQWHQAARSLG